MPGRIMKLAAATETVSGHTIQSKASQTYLHHAKQRTQMHMDTVARCKTKASFV